MIDPDDERTAVSRRRSSQDSNVESEPEQATRAATGSGAGPRRGGARSSDPEDGTTLAARQRPRGGTETAPARADGAAVRGGLDDPPPGDTPSSPGRVARAPGADSAPYRPRPVPPSPGSRAEPPVRAPRPYVDTAALETERRNRRRRRAIAVGAAASVLVVLAVVALVILLTTG